MWTSVNLTHLFLIHPFPTTLQISENLTVFWCFQGVGKRCIGNEWVTIVNFEEVNIQAKNYVFHLVILEKPSKPLKIFWVSEKSTKKFFVWNIYPLYDIEAKKYWKIFFEIDSLRMTNCNDRRRAWTARLQKAYACILWIHWVIIQKISSLTHFSPVLHFI